MIVNPNGGNSPRVEVATPMIDVSAGGLITAKTEQEKGYVPGGTKSSTKQLTTQAAKTVTPGTTNQTAVASGRYTTGAVTVKGDANLKAENIAEGVSIFGVTGTFNGESVETVTGTLARDGFRVYYAGGDGQTHYVENVMSISDVRKGSIVYCEDTKHTTPGLEIIGDIEEIFSTFMFTNSTSVFIANGDFSVS